MKTKDWVVIVIVIVVVGGLVTFLALQMFSTQEITALYQKLGELGAGGYNVKDYPGTFEDAKAERPDVDFIKNLHWAEFELKVAETKESLGFVTVWYHRSEGIMWVARYDWTYYYFEI